jgi:hypothetical protein
MSGLTSPAVTRWVEHHAMFQDYPPAMAQIIVEDAALMGVVSDHGEYFEYGLRHGIAGDGEHVTLDEAYNAFGVAPYAGEDDEWESEAYSRVRALFEKALRDELERRLSGYREGDPIWEDETSVVVYVEKDGEYLEEEREKNMRSRNLDEYGFDTSVPEEDASALLERLLGIIWFVQSRISAGGPEIGELIGLARVEEFDDMVFDSLPILANSLGRPPESTTWRLINELQEEQRALMRSVGARKGNPLGGALIRGGRTAADYTRRGYEAIGRGARSAAGYAQSALQDACDEAGLTRPNPKAQGKWTREKQASGRTIYARGGIDAYVVIVPYKPRVSPMAREFAGAYERTEGRKVPKGTKWLAVATAPWRTLGAVEPTRVSAHKTLAAAKKTGEAMSGPKRSGTRRHNPHPHIPAGALSSSYDPPPSPFGRQNVAEGALATSYNPPPSPFGRPDYSSGMLQGQQVSRSRARQPMSLDDWEDC